MHLLWSLISAASIVFSSLPISVSGVACHNTSQCAFDTITAVNDTYIECYGYLSCAYAERIESQEGDIECYGSYSCYQAKSLIRSGTENWEYISCFGLFSCAQVDYIENKRGWVRCYGEKSCYQSKIYMLSGADVYCYGSESCAESEIIATRSVYVYAHLGARNAVIISNDSDVSYSFYGGFGGYNATIICNDGHTCTIQCWGNGCHEMKLICNGNCTFDISCDYAEYSDVCPYGYKLPSDIDDLYEFPNLINITGSTYDNSYDTCNSSITNAINCDGYQECDSLSLDNDNGPICCTANDGCSNPINITADFGSLLSDTALINQIDSSIIRCDGYYSCSYAFNYIVGNGDIHLTAVSAGESTSASYGIINPNNNDVYCTSQYSCRYKEFVNGNNIYCLGQLGCQVSAFNPSINNIYAYGHWSLHYGQEVNGINNLYCGSRSACDNSAISNVHGDVYGSGYSALSSTEISNVTNSVIAFGYYTLASASVKNASNVYCIGIGSCINADISQFGQLYADGNDTLRSCSISSNLNGGTVKMVIRGTNAYDYDVNCTENDICFIDCQSSTGCENMNLVCIGTCYVDCVEKNGFNCPKNYTASPTSAPSAAPSNSPSFPSVAPTEAPSAAPVQPPTQAPTTTNVVTTTAAGVANDTSGDQNGNNGNGNGDGEGGDSDDNKNGVMGAMTRECWGIVLLAVTAANAMRN